MLQSSIRIAHSKQTFENFHLVFKDSLVQKGAIKILKSQMFRDFYTVNLIVGRPFRISTSRSAPPKIWPRQVKQ